jgi:integrase/recombinase XerC
MPDPTVTDWLAKLELDELRPATLQLYELTLRDFARAVAPTALAGAKPVHVDLWLAAMQARGLAPSTRRTRLSIVRTYYNHLLATGRIRANPAADHRPPKVDQLLPDVAAPDLLPALLDQCDLATPKGCRDLAILALLFATGARPSEIAALNRTSFDYETDRHWVTLSPGKGRRARRLPLHHQAVEYLRTWFQTRTDRLDAAFVSFRPYRAGRSVTRISTRAIANVVTELSANAGHRITPKIARSTCTSYLAAAGASPWNIADWLGHANHPPRNPPRMSPGHRQGQPRSPHLP